MFYKNLITNIKPKDKVLEIGPGSSPHPKATEFFQSLNRKVVFTESNDKYIDMCLMTLCNYHIIANSSFSWWGAWLSNSKKTIAPSRWFGSAPSAPKNWSDIYCKDWIII